MRFDLLRTLALFTASVAAAAASAGTYIESAHSDLREADKPAQIMKMWFDAGKFRAQSDQGERAQIFRDGTLYMLEVPQKHYTAIDKSSLDQLSATIAQMRTQMRAKMAGMPPEQRAMMEKMLGEAGSSAGSVSEPKRTVQATARTESVAGHRCTIWEVTSGGRKEQEVCVVPPATLPGGREVMATMRELGEMFQGFASRTGIAGRDAASQSWSELRNIDGIPVLTRLYENGRLNHEVRLTTIESAPVPVSVFEVPADFTQRKLNFREGA